MHHLAASGCSCVLMRQGIESFSVRIMQMAPRKQPCACRLLLTPRAGAAQLGGTWILQRLQQASSVLKRLSRLSSWQLPWHCLVRMLALCWPPLQAMAPSLKL